MNKFPSQLEHNTEVTIKGKESFKCLVSKDWKILLCKPKKDELIRQDIRQLHSRFPKLEFFFGDYDKMVKVNPTLEKLKETFDLI